MLLLNNCRKPKAEFESPKTPIIKIPSIHHIIISPNAASISPWESIQFSANAYDSVGNILVGKAIKWKSSDSNFVKIDQNGYATSNLLGTTLISAYVDTIKKSLILKVDISAAAIVSRNIILDSLSSYAETSVSVNPLNPLNIVASSNSANFCSFDGGRNWRVTPMSTAWADPNVFFSNDGSLYRQGLGGTSPTQRGIQVLKSIDGGSSFSSTNWAYKPDANNPGNIDQGMLCIDNSLISAYSGGIYIIGSDYPQGTPTYARNGFPLIFVKSNNKGSSWSKPIDISSSLNGGQEHSSQITTGKNGEIYAAWWNLNDQIVFTTSYDGGNTWGTNIIAHSYTSRSNPFVISDDVRGNISLDVDRSNGPYSGTIYLCSMDKNNINKGAADAWVKRSTDGGKTWSNPVYLSDGAAGPFKYYFQPQISVAPNGRLDAVWYDTRNWTGTDINNVTYDLYYTFSKNGGNNFNANIRVTPISSIKRTSCPTQKPCGERHLYEYIGLTSDNTRSMPVWTNIGNNGKSKPTFATIWIK